ncbi:DUF3570 domain-containing protein [uncultured Flavobacterium sp.]|uniref:DUF3570 domain-containing protein n=1 Tax=uncultured Flavobacterium sp. TaxID=165435 RepID=UPI0030EF17D2|tara:strand:- start:82044 stop:83519 length:1476 start_codon:yes stop_codon:yes gene_type:complete
MKNYILYSLILFSTLSFSQVKDSIVYKKRILETTEVDFLSSYYKQDGVHSAVAGGIGSEDLSDFASNIVISVPMNADDILTIDVGISAYTSASSSNINPFYAANTSNGDDDKHSAKNSGTNWQTATAASGTGDTSTPIGTPWQASSGASASDALVSLVANYSHSSDDRNFNWNADVSFSNEYDYTSVGFGGGIAKLFNNKNSELSLKANVYLDQWRPIYPTELSEFGKYGASYSTNGYFNGVTIINENGPEATETYLPSKFSTLDKVNRNSYSASFGFSQVATKKMQFSLFFDVIQQQGLLSTPYHRVYFADKTNFYIGLTQYIPVYETEANIGVYRLADDIERLPDSRTKIPVGARLNYYLNERVTIRTYYRYYWDNWDITSHTASIELPIKVSDKFTVFPMYRYYTQQQSKYFAGFEKHLSTEQYYTSDYDLSTFDANQFGFGVNYVDIFTNFQIWKFGLKNIDFRFNHYTRSDGLNANIGSIGFKFVM